MESAYELDQFVVTRNLDHEKLWKRNTPKSTMQFKQQHLQQTPQQQVALSPTSRQESLNQQRLKMTPDQQASKRRQTSLGKQPHKLAKYFDEEKGPMCFQCNKWGHLGKDCPEKQVLRLNCMMIHSQTCRRFNFLRYFRNLILLQHRTHLTTHKIVTNEALPLRMHAYRCPAALKEQFQQELDYLWNKGFIIPSDLPWAAHMFAVPKKNGKICLVVDYRQLNSVTVPDPYVMPRIEVILEDIGITKIFSTLDLKKGITKC